MKQASFVLNAPVIDDAMLDRIIQSTVFFSETVLVRSTFEARHTRGGLDARTVDYRTRELREAGLVKFWAHEYEMPKGSRATSVGSEPRPVDEVIGRSSFSKEIAEADEFLRAERERAYESGSQAGLRQGTAEVVGWRNELSNLTIASELNQDGLLSNVGNFDSLARRQAGRSGFREGVVTEVMSSLSLGPLTKLSLDQIIEARTFSADFRRLIDESLKAASMGDGATISAKETAEIITKKYREITKQYFPEDVRQEIAEEAMWDVSGLLLPASALFKYAVKAFDWRRQHKDARPFMLLSYLQKQRT